MKSKSETIVFFGSGPVAAEALKLLAKDFTVEAVVTKPVPAGHRGELPVLSLARALRLKTFTPAGRRELSELFATKPVRSLVGVVIDYGIIINKDVIDYFPLGIVNSHFSLLPRWRGADPISFAILEGDAKTGVSLMLIDESLDTGKLIVQRSLPIAADDTTPSLTAKLILLSHALLVSYLPRYLAGKLKPRAQPHPERATYSRKLTKDDGLMDWNKPAVKLEREIRAFLQWPKSHTTLGGKEVIITKAQAVNEELKTRPGSVEISGKSLIVQTGKGCLLVEKLKPAGKPEMAAEAFIAGYRHLLKP